MVPIRPRRSHSIFCFLISFLLGWLFLGRNEPAEMEDIQSAANWQRELVDQRPQSAPFFGQQAKLDRPRFAHSELGIRQQLLVLLLARSPPIAPSLFGLLSPKVPIRPLIPQSGPIPELPPNAQPISIRPGPVGLLSALANQSLHNSADWFFLLPDSTFLNIFQLQKLLSSLQWNSPRAFGHREGHYCQLEGGILLSAPAVHSLVQNRHLCHGLLPNGQNEDSTLETCIRLAANLTCEGGIGMDWWRIGAEGALENGGNNPNNPSTQLEAGSIHDQIGHLSLLDGFNSSTTISGLLSQKDVHSLEEHFLRVELAQMEAQIGELEFELGEMGEQIVGWPIGLQIPQKPPNRFQVPVWEMLDAEGKLFGNNPDENFIEEKMETGEWAELVEEAEMRASNCAEGGMPKMRQAYRRFSPGRGVDYFVDFECGGREGKWLERVQLVRPIESTKLVETVPFVKEDRELAILVPIDSAIQVRGIRPLLRRILGICLQQSQLESPKMRILVATRQMDAKLIRLLAADLGEMKRRCHSTLDSTLLLLKPDPFGQLPIQLAALDEGVDRFGPQNLFLLLSPFADFQSDFLDRTRLNAIRHFQVFFPIPFAEFNQFVAGLTPKEAEQFSVHKSRGRFDPDNWEVAALFGADFAWARARHSVLHPSAPSSLLDLFLGQSRLHLLRPIEPSLRIRPHPWICGQQKGREKCERRRRLGLGTRAQLARLVLPPPNNAENIGGNRNGQ